MILKGEKVVLRPITLADAPRFVKWFNDPQANRFLEVRKITLANEKKWIKDLRNKKSEKSFAIDTIRGKHIGVCGLHLSLQNKASHRAGFGIFIGEKKYWNQGFGTDAMRTLLDYGFKNLHLHRVEFDVYSYNNRAIHMYKKLGCKQEGIKRDHNFYKGKYYDSYSMGILDREWKKIRIKNYEL